MIINGDEVRNSENYYLKPEGEKYNISRSDKEKDLGVIFDEKLTFKQHIMAKVATANKMMGLIRRTYRFLNVKTFIKLYKTLVRVHLDYAASFWSPSSVHLIDELEAVQRRATKVTNVSHLAYRK